MKQAAGPQRLPVRPQALALLDDALVRAHAAVGLAADEEQPVGKALRQQQYRAFVACLAGRLFTHRNVSHKQARSSVVS